MSITITIPVTRLDFTRAQFEQWVRGERADCPDPYLLRYPDSFGFGEYIVGQHFAAQGYHYIHHDYDVFGENRPGKYPSADEILLRCLGPERFEAAKKVYRSFGPTNEPDLLIYKPDFSELRFAESKRSDTRDTLKERQKKGLLLLSAILGCPVDVFVVVQQGVDHTPQPITWEL